eukprot:Nitzschia sp. Nitz4//scaffold54_size114964//14188//15742//NITZ4_003836-RA/size114964-processed-gene-0.153-mRNA-1//1//CDS//3329554306//2143//frame0
MHFVVIVLGDVGRSPRMQYHAASLLEQGHVVSLVGYDGEDLVPSLVQHSEGRLHVVRFTVPACPKAIARILPLYYLWRVLSLILYLLWALFAWVPRPSSIPPVDCLLVQNPPAMPLLAIAQFYCWFHRTFTSGAPALVIDWHNLGYSMLQSNSKVAKLAKHYEFLLAPHATAHLCVTHAMKSYLQQEMTGVPQTHISVLYDCPPVMFQPLSSSEQHELLRRLHTDLTSETNRSDPMTRWAAELDIHTQTLFTEQFPADSTCRSRPGRPALITSSTSWTPDEDFGILLEAAVALDQKIQEDAMDNATVAPLDVLMVVTGKGPLKNHYLERISQLNMKHVAIQTVWLEPADYPKLLACADLGISLHTSTSGLDLPMKVLDLYGCGVPVCALDFSCLHELVQHDVNGKTFSTSAQLCEQLWKLLQPLTEAHSQGQPMAPHAYGDLDKYSQALQNRQRWSANWKEHAYPTLLRAVETSRSKSKEKSKAVSDDKKLE